MAIDYTGSNKDPDDPDSLHWNGQSGKPNHYKMAIHQVGSIVEPYDYDKQIPVFGFGAKPLFMGASKVEHCFPLTGNRENPNCLGVVGIMQKYDKTLMDILFSGPTLFAPVLETFKRQV